MKKLIGLNIIGIVLALALNSLNVVTMSEENFGEDINGNNYYMEGYGIGDKILIVENSYYEILAEIKIN